MTPAGLGIWWHYLSDLHPPHTQQEHSLTAIDVQDGQTKGASHLPLCALLRHWNRRAKNKFPLTTNRSNRDAKVNETTTTKEGKTYGGIGWEDLMVEICSSQDFTKCWVSSRWRIFSSRWRILSEVWHIWRLSKGLLWGENPKRSILLQSNVFFGWRNHEQSLLLPSDESLPGKEDIFKEGKTKVVWVEYCRWESWMEPPFTKRRVSSQWRDHNQWSVLKKEFFISLCCFSCSWQKKCLPLSHVPCWEKSKLYPKLEKYYNLDLERHLFQPNRFTTSSKYEKIHWMGLYTLHMGILIWAAFCQTQSSQESPSSRRTWRKKKKKGRLGGRLKMSILTFKSSLHRENTIKEGER